jgi:hypothetical protein
MRSHPLKVHHTAWIRLVSLAYLYCMPTSHFVYAYLLLLCLFQWP